MTPELLTSEIDTHKLTLEAPPLVLWEIGADTDIEGVAEYMYKGGPWPPQNAVRPSEHKKLSEDDPRPEKKYWVYVKDEMVLFLCEEDEKYEKLWEQIETVRKQGTTAIVGIIAAYMGTELGFEKTLLTGFIAVVLYGFAKLGKEALCQQLRDSRNA